jgi:hypothetical protein
MGLAFCPFHVLNNIFFKLNTNNKEVYLKLLDYLFIMKKIILTIFFLLSVVTTSRAQSNATTTEFYYYLNTILENKSNKNIQLLGTNYGLLGSKYHWEAKLKKKGKKIEIQYKSQQPNENDLLLMRLDTTYVITQKKLIQSFKKETIAIESRPTYYDETITISIKTTYPNKEFNLSRAEGLSFLLRYDKSFEEFYNIKIKD